MGNVKSKLNSITNVLATG